MLTYTAHGRPAAVRTYLRDFQQHADADELMVAHHAGSVAGRLRSIQLLGLALLADIPSNSAPLVEALR